MVKKLVHLFVALMSFGTVTAQAAQGTAVAYRVDSASKWSIQVNVATGTIVCQHADHPSDLFEVDYDDTATDGRYPGIYPTVGGVAMAGRFFYGDSALVTTPFTCTASSAKVESQVSQPEFGSPTDILRVRLEGTSYRDLNQAAGDEPLFTEAAIYYSGGNLKIDLYGLYYLLPSLADTRISMTNASGEVVDKQITTETAAAIEYYPEVTHVEVTDSLFGAFKFDTYCERLQIQVQNPKSYPGAAFDVFEFDFDHAFKDRGQRAVLTKLTIPLVTAQ